MNSKVIAKVDLDVGVNLHINLAENAVSVTIVVIPHRRSSKYARERDVVRSVPVPQEHAATTVPVHRSEIYERLAAEVVAGEVLICADVRNRAGGPTR